MLVARAVVAAIDTMLLMRVGRLGEAEVAADRVSPSWAPKRATPTPTRGTSRSSSPFGGYRDAAVSSFPSCEQLVRGHDARARQRRISLDRRGRAGRRGGCYTMQRAPRSTACSRTSSNRCRKRAPGCRRSSASRRPPRFSATRRPQHEAAQHLEPYASLPVMGSLAILCFGSAARALGLARRTLGDLDGAVDRARARSRAQPPARAPPDDRRSPARISPTTLYQRDGDDDRARADELLSHAISDGEALGLDARVARMANRSR